MAGPDKWDERFHSLAQRAATRSRAPHHWVSIEYAGRRFRSRVQLATYLASLTGRSAGACALMLSNLGDDADAVLRLCRESDMREQVIVNGKTYVNKAAFFSHMGRCYGLSRGTMRRWSQPSGGGLSLEQIEERANAFCRAKRPRG